MQASDILRKFNVTVVGSGEPTLVFAHGFGSDQTAWRHQVAALEGSHRIVLFDHLGCGKADVSAYNPRHYNSFERYAEDIAQIYEALGLRDTVFVGHSASAMIGILASFARPQGFASMVLLAGSPRYLDDEGYVGGFTQANLDSMYEVMADSYLGWANGFGPLAMANPERPELGRELAGTLSAMRPDIAQSIARVIFESDLRRLLPRVGLPTMILQTKDDLVVPMQVADYLVDHIPDARLVILNARGHLPHLSAPAEVTEAIRAFVAP
jgi:sigma-B regulation protein RsbQ